eukprot:TRINITY_DN19132_c0_g1::TRINITY_DN19132_c0_g1_i1::g.13856::m.13856 TRINITY_DN19132_c0_g1::TRINITY_DN19132_c0_g1_i1::g.13856  ORF type:complete len:158 (-),score=42.51,bZIP_1/PF00170.16/4.2e-09,bZIP_2/PF07716.10/6.4e+03,bZIP_2/PF07716.10/4.6e-07,DUF447/PF04289.7/0.081,DUF4094/PF13334.1/0.094,LacAB_rpiB/PF02502.13/0.23 TRINITY_DN19132_c0_g1_i1:28-501(-)
MAFPGSIDDNTLYFNEDLLALLNENDPLNNYLLPEETNALHFTPDPLVAMTPVTDVSEEADMNQPKKKRARLSEEERMQRRKERNRKSADRARKKKDEKILTLEARVQDLEVENAALKSWIAAYGQFLPPVVPQQVAPQAYTPTNGFGLPMATNNNQ